MCFCIEHYKSVQSCVTVSMYKAQDCINVSLKVFLNTLIKSFVITSTGKISSN